MQSEEKIKFAIVGSGHIGMRHAEMVVRNEEAQLVAMCDTDAEARARAGKYGVPVYASIEEMLDANHAIDIVNVCTPNGLHAIHAITALNHKHHVLCEKPMALSKADCEEMIHTSMRVQRHVFGVMQNRYSPPSVWIKEVIDKKLLGDIFMVQINCLWNRDDRYYKEGGWKGTRELDGGTLFTQFSHFIDIMYWLFGDITNLQGRFGDFNHGHSTDFEDSGMVLFNFVRGGMGSITYSTAVWDSNMESSMTVVGSKGTVKIGGQYMNEVVHCHIDGYEMPTLAEAGPANDYGAYKGSAANHHYIIENIIDTLKGRTSATTNALEGLKVVDIIERIYEMRDDKLKNKARQQAAGL